MRELWGLLHLLLTRSSTAGGWHPSEGRASAWHHQQSSQRSSTRNTRKLVSECLKTRYAVGISGGEYYLLLCLSAGPQMQGVAHLKHLQAVANLKKAVENYENPVFTTALIAGDDVILHIIHKVLISPSPNSMHAGKHLRFKHEQSQS